MSLYLRDSRHAANLYGLTGARLNTGTPRLKFQFFVSLRFNSAVLAHVNRFLGSGERDTVNALCKTATLPNISIRNRTLNQYNRTRIVQEGLEPQPISLTFHDTVDGLSLRLWEMYYEYYYKDGDNSRKYNRFDTVERRFDDNFGYNLQTVGNQRQLIDRIEIFQIHGGRFTRVSAISPTVTQFMHDTVDYAASQEILQFQLDFQPEYIVYNNGNNRLGSEALERFERGDFWEMFDFLNTDDPVSERNLSRDQFTAEDINNIAFDGVPEQQRANNVNLSRVQQPLTDGTQIFSSVPSVGSLRDSLVLPDSDRVVNTTAVDPGTGVVKRAAGASINDRLLLSGVADSRDTE